MTLSDDGESRIYLSRTDAIRRTCKRKKQYPNGKEAIDTLVQWAAEQPDMNIYDFAVYPCQFCFSWHIGRFPSVDWKVGPGPREGRLRWEQLRLFRRGRRRRIIPWNDPWFESK